MEAVLVCSANNDVRFACGALCGRCRHLIHDRRGRRSNLYRPRFRDRRRNHDAPFGPLQAASGSATLSHEAVSSRAAGALPLLLAAALAVFNLLDAVLTWRALSLGAVEANPVMSDIFNLGPAAAVLVKSSLVAAGAYFLWRCWHLPLARRGMMALTACYGAVVVYHLVFQFIVH